jgi:hypothetical protein
MTACRMRIACWITKATNTHSDNVILINFPLQQWLHERASVLRYMHIDCLLRFYLFICAGFCFFACYHFLGVLWYRECIKISSVLFIEVCI